MQIRAILLPCRDMLLAHGKPRVEEKNGGTVGQWDRYRKGIFFQHFRLSRGCPKLVPGFGSCAVCVGFVPLKCALFATGDQKSFALYQNRDDSNQKRARECEASAIPCCLVSQRLRGKTRVSG
jgi:hypothetical protein